MKTFRPFFKLNGYYVNADISKLLEMQEAMRNVVAIINSCAEVLAQSPCQEHAELSSDAEFASAIISSYADRISSLKVASSRHAELLLNDADRVHIPAYVFAYCNGDKFDEPEGVPF